MIGTMTVLRMFPILALLAAPAHAWQAGTDGALCTLTHESAEAGVQLTFDPSGPLYTITLQRWGEPWSPAPVFAIRFDGLRGLTISTSRHRLTGDDTAVTVADSGFGNVLDGLEFNTMATALLGDQALSVSLDGAAPEVRRFRACILLPVA